MLRALRILGGLGCGLLLMSKEDGFRCAQAREKQASNHGHWDMTQSCHFVFCYYYLTVTTTRHVTSKDHETIPIQSRIHTHPFQASTLYPWTTTMDLERWTMGLAFLKPICNLKPCVRGKVYSRPHIQLICTLTNLLNFHSLR